MSQQRSIITLSPLLHQQFRFFLEMFYTSCRVLDKPSYAFRPVSSSRLELAQQARLWQLLAAMDPTLKNNPDVAFVVMCNQTSCVHSGCRIIWMERSKPIYAGHSRRGSCRLASWFFNKSCEFTVVSWLNIEMLLRADNMWSIVSKLNWI